MDNVQKHNNCINIPSSQTFKCSTSSQYFNYIHSTEHAVNNGSSDQEIPC
jgi:hypothetical protein